MAESLPSHRAPRRSSDRMSTRGACARTPPGGARHRQPSSAPGGWRLASGQSCTSTLGRRSAPARPALHERHPRLGGTLGLDRSARRTAPPTTPPGDEEENADVFAGIRHDTHRRVLRALALPRDRAGGPATGAVMFRAVRQRRRTRDVFRETRDASLVRPALALFLVSPFALGARRRPPGQRRSARAIATVIGRQP
jgi:hypothetical protein